MKILLTLLLNLMISFVILSRTISSQSLPGCPHQCGNVTIHYPFGTKKGCYLSELYHVNCSKLQVFNTNFKLLNISLDGYMHGSLPAAQRCYGKNAPKPREPRIWLSRFSISSTENLLTTIGCDARANMKEAIRERISENLLLSSYIMGCSSMKGCYMLRDGLCSGIGCSQVPIPYKATSFRIHTQRNTNRTVGKWRFNNCTYGFIVKKGHYTFQETDFDNLQNRTFPAVFEWSVGNTSCEEARKDGENYVCGEHSVCIDTNDTLTDYNQSYEGYRCRCAKGYNGNPYIKNSCQDINECERPDLNDCVYGCANTKGSYDCSCFWGQHGDGRTSGTGCKYSGGTIFVGVSVSIGASGTLTLILYWGLSQRQVMKSREIFFKKNGGLILQKLLFESKQSSRTAKVFSARVLEKATNKFHKSNIVGHGGYGTVYKGTLPDKTMVAIKKSKSIDENHIEQFINEVIILSDVSHPNVVKLLGCCLETQTPLLVYEFITNQTVFKHLHEQNFISSLNFEKRLNIARQTADALSYIHSMTKIVHRDIKTSNILLTDDYTAKVSDFGISRFIPVDETHLQTLVHGTLGYIDPEYFRSGILTEKSDVYSFGMVLVELLTGRKVYSHDGTESDLGLAMFFVSSLERGCLIQVLDDKVRNDGPDERVKKLAKLAKDCVELEGKKRPNMKEVKEELEELCHFCIKTSIISHKVKYFDSDQLTMFDW